MTRPAPSRRISLVVVTFAVGCTLLGLSLTRTPGDGAFYPLVLGVAIVWTVGGLASGPLPWRGRPSAFRSVAWSVGIGLAAGALFVVGALVIREIGPLRDFVSDALDHERRGNTAVVAVLTLLNVVGEEIFFRGAVYAAFPRSPIVWTTAAYVAATAATGNPMLIFAAVVMGSVFTLVRRRANGILDPIVVHLVWSSIMLATLPAIIG